ncbi:glycosyltransferase family 39 protein [bacterium]|nr:glycosyltransferase family 39 protein [bacterium]
MSKIKIQTVYLITLLFLTLVVSFTSFYKLDSRPLWGDEQRTVNYYAKKPFRVTNGDPPLFPFLIHHINKYTNELFWLRFLNALALIAGTLLIAVCCRNWFGKKISLCAAFAFATSFLVISRGQWVRPYALFTFLILLSYVSFWKLLKTASLKWMIINIISTIIALYTHYSTLVIVINQLIFGCIYALTLPQNKNKILIRVLSGTGIITLCSFPWYYHLFKTLSRWYSMNVGYPPKDFNLAIYVYHIIVKVFPVKNPEIIHLHSILVLLILTAGIILSLRKKKYFSVLLTLSWIASSAGFLWINLERNRIFMAQRYYISFVPALYLLIFLGIFEITDLISERVKSKYKTTVSYSVFSVITIYIFVQPVQFLCNYYFN